MKTLLLAVILIALLLGLMPVGVGAHSADSPIATPGVTSTPTAEPFASPIGTPYPTAIRLIDFEAK